MLSIGIHYQRYTDIPTLLGSDFGVMGHLCGVKMMSLQLHSHTVITTYFPPDLGEVSEIIVIGDVSVETLRLHYG